jgi:hypothetical protein
MFLASASAQVENELSYEVNHVQTMVTKGLAHLQSACQQMKQVERELRRFLDDYYAQVGSFFEQLELLKREITDYDRKIYQVASKRCRKLAQLRNETPLTVLACEEIPAMLLDLGHNDWEVEMKKIYRNLVKLYHPDIRRGESCSTRVLQLINKAYEKRDLWAMREVEHRLVEYALAKVDSPESTLQRLRNRYEAIAESARQATERKQRVLCSEAWQLKMQYEQNRYVIEIIIHRVKQQIAHAKHILAQKRIEYQAVLL